MCSCTWPRLLRSDGGLGNSLPTAFPRLSTQQVKPTSPPVSLAHAVSSGPYNFASAVLRVDQDHCLGRQRLRRGSPPGGKVAPKDVGRVGARTGGKRAPKKIYAPARITRRITGVPAELRGAKVPRSAPPRREGPARPAEAGQLFRSAPATDPDPRACSHAVTTDADAPDAATNGMRLDAGVARLSRCARPVRR